MVATKIGKLYAAVLCIIFCCALRSFGQSVPNDETDSVTIAKPDIDYQYYGFPLVFRAGYFYRRDDFSIFPNAGVRLAPEGGNRIAYKLYTVTAVSQLRGSG